MERNNQAGILRNGTASDRGMRIFFAVLLVAALAGYYLIYANKTFPYTEGWGIYYVELIKHGKFPYRDFYYYLPPLNLLVDYVLWTISNGYFLIYRLLRLAERILMMEVLYFTLTKYYKAHFVCLACVIGGILGADTYDLLGDYSQTAQVCLIGVTYFATKFAETSSIKTRRFTIAVAGCIIGLAFLMKQTHGVATILVFFIALCVFCYAENDCTLGQFLQYCGLTALGILLPVLICSAVLVANQAFLPFVEQVFINTGSKGSLVRILFASVGSLFVSSDGTGNYLLVDFLAFVLLALIGRVIGAKKASGLTRSSFRWNTMLIAGTVVAMLYLLYCRYALSVFSTVSALSSSGFLWMLGVLAVPILVFALLFHKELSAGPESRLLVVLSLYVFILFAIGCYFLSTNRNKSATFIYSSSAPTLVGGLSTLCTFGLFAAFLVAVVCVFIRKKWLVRTPVFMLIAGAVSNCYAFVMAAGLSLAPQRSMFFALPILLLLVMQLTLRVPYPRVWYHHVAVCCISVLCVLFCFFNLAQKICNTYSWWGWSDGPITEKTETVDLEALKGFRFSKQEKTLYEEVVRVIDTNTKEGDTVLGFPYLTIFNILTEHYEMNGFVPVYFFDVCADSYASADAQLFKTNEPDLVIWCDLTPYCWDMHEQFFRNGARCGQRDIQEWFSSVKDTDYNLVGQVESLFIYKLNDENDSAYTYIQDQNRENTTAEEINLRRQEDEVTLQLKGAGTKEDPYQISSVPDLKNFRDAVNNGNDFAGKYLIQSTDLDLSDEGNWKPIGKYAGGNYFAGAYDGGGHSIRGLTIVSMHNVGLFGTLGGTVKNLQLLDCNIRGYCVGAIATNAIGTPTIINCYTSGKLVGTLRAGGIADNFSGGTIQNCASTCTLAGKEATSQIVSYDASVLRDCAFVEGIDIPETLSGTKQGNAFIADAENAASFLNDSIELYVTTGIDTFNRKFSKWMVDGGGSLCLSTEEFLAEPPGIRTNLVILSIFVVELLIVLLVFLKTRKKPSATGERK